MTLSATVTGVPELVKLLRQMPIEVEQKLGIQALRAAATPIKKQIIAALPESDLPTFRIRGQVYARTHLKKSVGIWRPKGVGRKGGGSASAFASSTSGIRIRVGITGKQARLYAKVVEYGNSRSSPHPVWRQAMAANANVTPRLIANKLYKDIAKRFAKLGR